ncbi:hypothetical protein C8J57DRAFT_1539027 [Mycena rebaudengoi]|nr:hypothetical protein C8J57DRAFT_1539027 [Mycena rebaudengoi]
MLRHMMHRLCSHRLCGFSIFMLPDLSAELLEEIGSRLPHSDHSNLRAVCKDLDGAMQRLFFSVLVLTLGL